MGMGGGIWGQGHGRAKGRETARARAMGGCRGEVMCASATCSPACNIAAVRSSWGGRCAVILGLGHGAEMMKL